MLKGKTKIELTDTRNGNVRTYEDTNMFTNGVQKIVSYTGILDNNKFSKDMAYIEKDPNVYLYKDGVMLSSISASGFVNRDRVLIGTVNQNVGTETTMTYPIFVSSGLNNYDYIRIVGKHKCSGSQNASIDIDISLQDGGTQPIEITSLPCQLDGEEKPFDIEIDTSSVINSNGIIFFKYSIDNTSGNIVATAEVKISRIIGHKRNSGTQEERNNGVLSDGKYPTIDYFTGGLMLFSDYVNEDASQLTIPQNNTITGRACLENNQSTKTAKNGSYAGGEFLSAKSFRQIWDFNEDQSNGTISCVSLTTPLGAVKAPIENDDNNISYGDNYPYNDIIWGSESDGDGNSSNTMLSRFYKKDPFIVNEDEDDYVQPRSHFKDDIVLIDEANNCYYALGNITNNTLNVDTDRRWDIINERKLKLNKYRIPFNNFSIFDNRTNLSKYSQLIGTVELNFPQEIEMTLDSSPVLQTFFDIIFTNDDNYLYIMFFTHSTSVRSNFKDINCTINSDYSSTAGERFCYLFKFDLVNFECVKYWELSHNSYVNNFPVYIYSWRSSFLGSEYDFKKKSGEAGQYIYLTNIRNGISDLTVFNDKLYFFGKVPDEDIRSGQQKDVFLYCYDLDNHWLEKVKFNNEPIKFEERDYLYDGREDISVLYGNYGTEGQHGVFEDCKFSLINPAVSMVNGKDCIYITMLCNGKTFVVNNNNHLEGIEEVAYLKFNDKTNNPFWVDIKYQLETPMSEYIDYLYAPNQEKVFYVINSNNLFLKLKNKYRKPMPNDASYGNTNYFIDSNDYVWYGAKNVKYYSGKRDSDLNRYFDYSNDYGCYEFFLDPTILITINNLEQQIVKKNYEKMRVTYTITEV